MLPLPNHSSLSQGVKTLKGVGPQIEKALEKRGLQTVGDLLSFMPSRYQDRRRITPLGELVPETEVLTGGRIEAVHQGRFPKTGRPYFEITISDQTGQISALWFRLPAHLRYTLKKGQSVLLFGRVQFHQRRLSLTHPEVQPWKDEPPAAEVRPVYPEVEDIRPGTLRRIMAGAQRSLAGLPTVFPRTWLKEHGLPGAITCLQTLHQPPADRPGPLPRPRESKAWRSLALYELIFLQLTLARSRARQGTEKGWACPARSALVQDFLAGLPFQLTASQAQALDEVNQDMASPRPMNRLLQGDVGSGKTILALAAAFCAVHGGRQAALMVPTEILARQHFQTLAPHAKRLGVTADLLLGGLAEAEKTRCREDLASGKTRLIIGTHALISKAARFKSLGLAVIDEQHRFGVAQRLALRAKAENPDILVMTATPIPRTLAMTLYGDLDISTIQGLPPDRKPIKTMSFDPGSRMEAYQILLQEIKAGGQAFVVAPRIEAQAQPDAPGENQASAESLFEFVRDEVLPRFKVGLVHGRMKPDERQETMAAFRSGKIRVLVATTVIEVGLDVAGASVILIEAADRFGLAQLHQLRGRVGRGERPAQCLLVAGVAEAHTRLKTMVQTNDGFILAEEDLKLRGPGDALGVKQSGLPPLTWARLPQDLSLLVQARALAQEIIGRDPELKTPPFKLVREAVDRLDLVIQTELADVG